MGQVSTLTIWPAHGGKIGDERRREYKRRKRQ